METEKRNTISIVILSVLLIAFGFYVYQDLFKNGSDETENEQLLENTSTTTPNSISTTTSAINISAKTAGGDDITITPIEISPESQEKQQKTVDFPVPVPNLDRQIMFEDSFPEDARQKMAEKIDEISQILKNNPQSFGDWINLGLYRKMIGDYEGAGMTWEYATLLQPEKFLPYGNLGDLYAYYLKNNQKAEENYLKAIELEPTQIYLYFKTAEFYRDFLKDDQKAIEIVQKGLVYNPNSSELQSLLQTLTK